MLNKLERYLFYILLFSIPFQTRKILYFAGWRFNEWQSVSVYLTDVIFGLLVLFWIYNACFLSAPKLKSKNEKLKITIQNLKVYESFLFIFLIFSAISIKNSSNLIVSFYQFAKLAEFVLFFFYLKNYAIYKFGFTNSLFAIFSGGIFQAVIAIVQFFRQSDIGLSYLGESFFNLDVKGVAAFYNFYGEKIIRAYGTTPHPNVLSAYLFVAVFCFYFIWFYKRSDNNRFFIWGYFIILWGLLLTFSRVAIFLLGFNYLARGGLLIFKFKKFNKKIFWQLIGYTTILTIFFLVLYWPETISRVHISGEEDAVQLRSFYNKESLKIISWTGTGIGDFVNELEVRVPMLASYLYQPVHNIYLLIYAETGILGISAFLLFLFFLVKDFIDRTKLERIHHYSLFLLFGSTLFMGLFDHFLWTLQQGRFLFWLVLATLAINEKEDIG